MKVLNCSDVHLGFTTHGKIDQYTGYNTRVLETLDALDRTIDYAINNQVDLFTVAGDVYHRRIPTPNEQRDLATRLVRLTEANIPVIIVGGNHDQPGLQDATSLDVYKALNVPRVHVVSRRPEVVYVGDLQVACFPYIEARALADVPYEGENKITDQKYITTAKLHRLLLRLHDQVGDSKPAILVAHIAAFGATFTYERRLILGEDPTALLMSLAQPKYSACLLGHFHKAQLLSSDPIIAYTGSLTRIDFSEEDQLKGFHILTLDEHSPPVLEFVELDVNKLITIDIDGAGGGVISPATLDASDDADKIENAIVRMRVQAETMQQAKAIDRNALRRWLYKDLGAQHVVSVDITYPAAHRGRLDEPVDIQDIGVEEALTKYLIAMAYPRDRISILIENLKSLAQLGDLNGKDKVGQELR